MPRFCRVPNWWNLPLNSVPCAGSWPRYESVGKGWRLEVVRAWMLAGLVFGCWLDGDWCGWQFLAVLEKKTPRFCNCENTGYLKKLRMFWRTYLHKFKRITLMVSMWNFLRIHVGFATWSMLGLWDGGWWWVFLTQGRSPTRYRPLTRCGHRKDPGRAYVFLQISFLSTCRWRRTSDSVAGLTWLFCSTLCAQIVQFAGRQWVPISPSESKWSYLLKFI